VAGNLKPWRKGQSGNPSGRPAVVAEVRDLARQHTSAAIKTLVRIMEKGKPDQARVAAACALLDSGYGKPIQALQTDAPRPLLVVNIDTSAADEAPKTIEAPPLTEAAAQSARTENFLRSAMPEDARDGRGPTRHSPGTDGRQPRLVVARPRRARLER